MALLCGTRSAMDMNRPRALSHVPTVAVLALLSLGGGTLVQGHEVQDDPLARWRWKKRILLLFVPGEGDPRAETFRQAANRHEREIVERDLLVFVVLNEGKSTLGDTVLDWETARELRSSLEVQASDTMLILVGKDGGVKYRGGATTELRQILDLIDTMPMRQREMNKRTRDPEND